SRHAALAYRQDWLALSAPFLLLALGLPLALFAAGLKFRPLWRAVVNIPAFFVLAGGYLLGRRRRVKIVKEKIEDDEIEAEAEDEDPYGLSIRPEPLAGPTRADERRREIRVKREERKIAKPAKTARQPALNLGASEYQLPPLGLLAEPVHIHAGSALSDDALEENARMLEAVLAD